MGGVSIDAVDLATVIAIVGLVLSAVSTAFTAMAYFQARALGRSNRVRPVDVRDRVVEVMEARGEGTYYDDGIVVDRLVVGANAPTWRQRFSSLWLWWLVLFRYRAGLLIISCILTIATALYIWLARPIF
jgi:hypothetical protein